MKGPNLSAWALDHQPLIRHLIGLLLLSGTYIYFTLGQLEDPEFTSLYPDQKRRCRLYPLAPFRLKITLTPRFSLPLEEKSFCAILERLHGDPLWFSAMLGTMAGLSLRLSAFPTSTISESLCCH